MKSTIRQGARCAGDDEMQTTESTIAWDCRQAKLQLALKAGGDLADPVASALLERHLAACPQCRRYLAGMEAALELLQSCSQPTAAAERSVGVWPRVSARLPSARERASRFQVWAPTVAMAAACAAMILVTIVQVERVASFDPIVTPRVKTLTGQSPRNLFLEDADFARGRMPIALPRIDSSATPVRYLNTPEPLRLEFPAEVDSPSRQTHLEW